jgi:hypothetical protein
MNNLFIADGSTKFVPSKIQTGSFRDWHEKKKK